MREIIVALFGNYEPLEGVEGIAAFDWEWIFGAVIFTVFLYCLMRMLGGWFSK